MILQTSNPDIFLRPFGYDDARDVSRIGNNRNIWLNVRDQFPHPYREQDAINFVKMIKENDKDHVMVIIYHNNIVGVTGLHVQSDVYSHSAELGYFIDEAFWNKGIASTVVKRMVSYGFEILNLHRIFASVFAHNTASMKVLEKSGFIKEGIKKDGAIKDGKIVDEHCFGIINQSI